ncbi:MAG: hypothetical protein JJU07_11840 [Natronohydrobacter sp.]|nr:hypothetical protein [Natronohydrobacter sp.]
MQPIQIYGTTPRYSQVRLSSDQKPGSDSRAAAPVPVQHKEQAAHFSDWALI